MRFLFVCVVVLAVFFTLSRTQVNEHAKFFTRGGEVLEGRVSRDFLTGDFVIQTAEGQRDIPQDQFGGMAYQGSAISMPVAWLGGVAIVAAGLMAMFWPGLSGGRSRQ